MSMIRDTVQRQRPIRINLLYGSRAPEDVIFVGELEKLAAAIPTSPCPWSSQSRRKVTRAQGILDSKVITQLVGDINGKTFYVCGPRHA